MEVGYLHFFIHFSHREEEDEEEQEEFGDFRLVTDDNAFDSDEVWTDGVRQLLQPSDYKKSLY